ncbi:MAG: ribonuclease M5 [Peptoniphilus sp. oral taxon 375]|uniref:ribonuclease M5 n=1 Tax=Urinicoccus timonensis TaxID=2024205 RepID=UPI000C06CA78|nr:ribonuclease M5 [Urinicoccus timonensis]MBS4872670.1 ribonuclease M5 [Peptoniphilus sp. oral taxon 375]
MKKIREIIVVEGRDDITAVRSAVEAQVVQTRGYSYGKKLIDTLQLAQKNRGVIVLTDPDYMGEKIRKDLDKRVPGIKHAFISTDLALKGENIGVENAKPQAIIEALERAQATLEEAEVEFTEKDLRAWGLSGGPQANERRKKLGKALHLGQCNSKQFLKRLNAFGISREEVQEKVRKIDGQ